MLNAIFISTPNGSLVLFRAYRDNFTKEDAVRFCHNYIRDAHAPLKPVLRVGVDCYFIVTIYKVLIIASTKGNANAVLYVQCLCNIRRLLYNFMGGLLSEETLLSNVDAVYELFDEVVDFGYPQNLHKELLQETMCSVINPPLSNSSDPVHLLTPDYLCEFGVDPFLHKIGLPNGFIGKLTSENFGIDEQNEFYSYIIQQHESKNVEAISVVTLPWRPRQSDHRKDDLSIFVKEHINVLYSKNGEIMSFDIKGSVVINCQLKGMPLVEIIFNNDFKNLSRHFDAAYETKLSSSEFKLPIAAKKTAYLDDVKFHTCVLLDNVATHGKVCCVPPEGPTVLMLYHTRAITPLPFIFIPNVTLLSSTVLKYEVFVKPTYLKKLCAAGVQVIASLPENVRKVTLISKPFVTGFEIKLPHQKVIWNLSKVCGGSEFKLEFHSIQSHKITNVATIHLLPISLNFELPNFVSSGLYISRISMDSKKVSKSVSYSTQSGHYLHRCI